MVWHDNPNPSRPLLVLTTLLLIWTTLFAGIRVWARWQQQRSWLDVTFVGGYIVAASQCTTVFLAIARYGFGEKGFDTPSHASPSSWKHSLFAGEILYILNLGISKFSTALFLSRLSRERRQNITGTALAALAVVWAIASMLAVGLRGNLSSPWLLVGPNWTRWLGVETSGLILEAAFYAFAFSLVSSLQMRLRRKMKVLAIFGARLFLIPLVAYRLVRLSPSTYHGSIYDITMVNIFTELVMHFALFAECLTSLRPFMQTFHEGLAAEDATDYWGGLAITTGQQSSNGYVRDSNGKKKALKVSSREVPSWRHARDDDTKLSRSGFSTKIESGRRGDRSTGGDDDIELLSPDPNRIWVQQETNVEASK